MAPSAAAQTPVDTAPTHPKTGVWSWVTTVDHKRIGIMYGVSAFAFFLIGGLEALLLRVQLGSADNTFLSPETYNQLFTMHGTTMIFLGVMPLSAMFFNYLIPLQIGARDVVFPRLNAFSFWVFLIGGLLLNASFLFGAAPNAGWFGYANLTETQYSPGVNTDFWIAGLQILGISSLAAAVNFFVTIINMRAPGMRLLRMPMFCWMSLITQILLLLAFPVITVALVFLMLDRYFGATFFQVAANGDPMMWQHLFWIFGHPEVYILILPPFGIVSEILPVFSRKPLFGYAAMVFSGAFIAVLGFGVWSHHMFATGMGPIADASFGVLTLLIAIPTGVKIFNWIGTIWGGSIQMKTPMYFALGFIAMFIIGGLSGVMHAAVPADLQQTDTYFVVAHFHYVLFGGSVFAIMAGAYFWIPKMFGFMLRESIGKFQFWLMFIGFNVTFFPMHLLGLHGMPRRVYTYPEGLGFEFWNQVETAGSFLLGLSFLVFIWNVIVSKRSGEPAPADPWNGATLEWSIPSPPQEFNFPVIPEVRARDALWQMKRAAGGSLPEPERVNGDHIHLPNPSVKPLITAMGIGVFFIGFLLGRVWPMPASMTINLPIIVIGFAITIYGIFSWAFEPPE